MKDWLEQPGSLTDVRLMELLIAYDEIEQALQEPEPALPSYPADLWDPADKPLRRVDSLNEYNAYSRRRHLDETRRRQQQNILEQLVAEGMPLRLWVHAGEDRFVYVERLEEAHTFSDYLFKTSSRTAAPGQIDGGENTSEGLAKPHKEPQHSLGLRLYSVHRGALEDIPPVSIPDLIVPISKEIDLVEDTHPSLTRILAGYHKPLAVTIFVLLFVLIASDTAFPGFQIGGASLTLLALGALMLVAGGSCILARLDRSVGPGRVRKAKITLWQFYLDADRATATASYHKALSESHTKSRRL